MPATAARPYTPPKPPKAMSLKEAQERGPLNLVDPTKVYRVIIQLGTRVTWRKFGHGEFTDVKQRQTPDPRQQARMPYDATYKPAVHDVGAIMGETLNGLISCNNAWLAKNENKEGNLGLLNFQILVVDFEETNEAATDKPVTLQLDVDTIAKISAASAREAVAATIDALTKNKGGDAK